MNAGENIKKLREELNLTQADVSRISGIGEKYLSAIERGKKNPGGKTIPKLCDVFGVDEMTLLYGERKETAPMLDTEAVDADVKMMLLKELDCFSRSELLALLAHASKMKEESK